MSKAKNATDRIADELKAVVQGHPPDYVAPPLTNLLVRAARDIGLSRRAVHEQIDFLWDLHDRFTTPEAADE